MGSATREALAASRAALGALSKVDATTGEQLLAAGRVIGDSAPLTAALVDSTAEAADRAALANAVFAGYGANAKKVLAAAVSQRWSTGPDLLAGVEELGFRALARSSAATGGIERELFAFGRAVASSAELELAISSKLGTPQAKASLVAALVANASRETRAILEHIVQQPRGRRIGELLRHASTIVADERGQRIATVTTAEPLGIPQAERLGKVLGARYGTDVLVQSVVDPTVIGGMRITVGDDVIDGTVQRRLADLRLQLAG
jgi:F-type H+-transporting ATPase subunit delta